MYRNRNQKHTGLMVKQGFSGCSTMTELNHMQQFANFCRFLHRQTGMQFPWLLSNANGTVKVCLSITNITSVSTVMLSRFNICFVDSTKGNLCQLAHPVKNHRISLEQSLITRLTCWCNECIQICEKTLEFSSVISSTPSLYHNIATV